MKKRIMLMSCESERQCVHYLGQGVSDICTEKCPVIIDWEEFLKEAKIRDLQEHHDGWLVSYRDMNFRVYYSSFIGIPRNLVGEKAYKIAKLNGKDSVFDTDWEIHVRAQNMPDHTQEVLRAVWCHLARRGGDYCVMYVYDRLDKSRPEGTIGEPVELENGIKRWRLRPHLMSVAEMYLYIFADGKEETIVLIETLCGYKWETSLGYYRHDSLKEAEEELLKHFSSV